MLVACCVHVSGRKEAWTIGGVTWDAIIVSGGDAGYAADECFERDVVVQTNSWPDMCQGRC